MNADPHLSVPPNNLTAREAVLRLRGSKIREVANASLGRSDVLAFWFGEPDEQTPQFIRRAGMASLEAGETFYTHNFGLIELRTALAEPHLRAARTGCSRKHHCHELRHVGADARDAGAGRCR